MKKALPFILVGVLALFVVLVQFYFPKPINWDPTFEKRDKNPYGDYLLYDFVKDIFPGKKIELNDRTLYEELDYYDYTQEDYTYADSVARQDSIDIETPFDEEYVSDSIAAETDSLTLLPETAEAVKEEEELQNSAIIKDIPTQQDTALAEAKNYIIINSKFSPGDSDAEALLKFVSDGNNAFVSAEEMSGVFADSLKVKINNGYYEEGLSTEDLKSGPKKDSIYLVLLNTRLSTYEKKYWYRDGTVSSYFSSVDTANALVLGKNSQGNINFVRIRYGEGYFYLSATPLAFTNYNMMLADNAAYISACLSYLPVRDTYWDEYYKNYREADSNSLRFIESQPPLYWAYYLALWSAVVYIVFESKRRQRVIPIVEPPKNTTLEFVSTIGRLYFQNGNHKDIADKKIY